MLFKLHVRRWAGGASVTPSAFWLGKNTSLDLETLILVLQPCMNTAAPNGSWTEERSETLDFLEAKLARALQQAMWLLAGMMACATQKVISIEATENEARELLRSCLAFHVYSVLG